MQERPIPIGVRDGDRNVKEIRALRVSVDVKSGEC
jgi:hypothetical protein